MYTAGSRRGTSLVEVVVASTIGLILLSATYELLVPGLRAWTTSNRRSHIRQGGLATITRLSRDLKMTCIESVVLVPGRVTDPQTGVLENTAWLSFVNACDESGRLRRHEDGFPDWQKYEVIYHDPQRQEVRLGYRDLAYDESKTPAQLKVRLEAMVPQARDRVIGRKIVGLTVEGQQNTDQETVEPPASTLRVNPIVLRIHIREDNEDCVLDTSTSTALLGNPALGEPGG